MEIFNYSPENDDIPKNQGIGGIRRFGNHPSLPRRYN